MAKQWFNYVASATTFAAQITPANYLAVGAYPSDNQFCTLATRTCLLYTYTSSGTSALPSPSVGGAPAISTKIQAYIAAFTTGGGAVQAQPISGKKYLYVRGT